MSKKMLKIASRRPMLLALIVMATLTLGLLFSGWFTPTPGRAQQGGGNGGSNGENPDCEPSSSSANCADGWVVLTNIIVSPGTNISFGNTLTATVTQKYFELSRSY